jgi:predicted small lipoprotein YifL
MCKCWTQWLLIAVIFIFSLMTLLAGCGIKGPIYLPDEKQKKAALEKNKSQSYAPTLTATQNNKD